MASPSVIFGTIHLCTDETLHHWPQVQHIITQYDRIYTESSLFPEEQSSIRPHALLPSGQTYLDFISERRWVRMRKVFLKYCRLDIDLYKTLRPLMLSTAVQSALIKVHNDHSLDQMIWQEALHQNKKPAGIETIHEQIQILRSLDIKTHYQHLSQISRNISKTRRRLNRILRDYQAQKINKLYHISKQSLGTDRTQILIKRNEIMADRLMSMHAIEPSFFTFGAGHLSGGKGVLRLLKDKGAFICPLQ
jgi:Uncharacterized protein conserved in bacteria